MANNTNLGAAKAAKNDEFYTQYADIQKEVNAYLEYNPDTFRDKTVLLPCDDPEWSNFTRFFAQNFERLGLKRLISTSYAVESKKYKDYEPTLFETESPLFDIDKTRIKGKIFELTRDTNGSGRIDIDDLEWHYLEGDGDFRSPEVCALRDQSDIIVTNPPFSLFREFLAWIFEAPKNFLIIGNMNAITYREVFPLIKEDRMWMGNGFASGNAYFKFNGDTSSFAGGVYNPETGLVKFRNCCWFTNLDHGRRHEPLMLMSMKDNIRFGRHKDIRERGYNRFANYDAIDVPYIDAIPSDYDGVMGVPLTFLDKYCPEQFEIIWRTGDIDWAEKECTFFTPPTPEDAARYKKQDRTWRVQNPYFIGDNGVPETCYFDGCLAESLLSDKQANVSGRDSAESAYRSEADACQSQTNSI